MDQSTRSDRNSFITRSFRDTADQDYIVARACWRIGLRDQFMWSGLQAMEKYFKTIILFHDGDTRMIRHDLKEALRIAVELQEEEILNGRAKAFLLYLDAYGQDRYFCKPTGTRGQEILQLDHAVWSVRRFCEDLDWLREASREKGTEWHARWIAYRQSRKCSSNPMRFRLKHPGYLEDVLDGRADPGQRETLVWKNLYFGSRRKKSVRMRLRRTARTPSHYFYPGLQEWLSKRVFMPKSVMKEYRDAISKRESAG